MFRRVDRAGQSLSLRQSLRRFWREDAAQDLIEYSLLTALIGLMCAAALSPVAQALSNGVNKVEKKFEDHTHHDNGKHKGWYK